MSSTGWQNASTVNVILHSEPVTLGTPAADSTGKIVGTYTVPASTPVGVDELELTGKGASGATRTIKAAVMVAASTTSSTTGGSSTSSTAATSSSSGSGSGSSGGLPLTGGNALRIGLSALLVVSAGWMLLVAAVHRRDRLGSTR